jgi:K+-transporting ATPase KdpF subunit
MNHYDRPFLCSCGKRRPVDFLGLREGLRQTVRRIPVDYIIAGVISLALFAYLVYALLKPERF